MEPRLIVEYHKAISLRKQGYSYGDIASMLKISKGTSYLWCSEVALANEQRMALVRKPGFCAGKVHIAKSQARRKQMFAGGMARAEHDENFRLLCAFYWGEGYKRGAAFSFCNSDIKMMLAVARCLQKEVTSGKMVLRVSYYPQNGIPTEDIEAHWQPVLDTMPSLEFRLREAQVSIASKRKTKRKVIFGTASLQINSCDFLYQVLGGIEFLGERLGRLAETV